ncbi:MAG: HAD family hydrolase [Phycisphaerae bacterium]
MITIDDIQLVVFDLDDTLYPEADFVEGGFRNVAAALVGNDPSLIDQLVRKMRSLLKAGRRDIFQTILAEMKKEPTPEQISQLVKNYRTADRPLTLFPDAERAIDRFRQNELILAILTDGPAESQQTKVKLLDLEKRFDQIIYTGQYGPEFAKPNPHCFEILMNKFGVEPSRCIYIADNEVKDFLAPNILGWRSVKVTRPTGIYFHLPPKDENYKPEYSIESLDDIDII